MRRIFAVLIVTMVAVPLLEGFVSSAERIQPELSLARGAHMALVVPIQKSTAPETEQPSSWSLRRPLIGVIRLGWLRRFGECLHIGAKPPQKLTSHPEFSLSVLANPTQPLGTGARWCQGGLDSRLPSQNAAVAAERFTLGSWKRFSIDSPSDLRGPPTPASPQINSTAPRRSALGRLESHAPAFRAERHGRLTRCGTPWRYPHRADGPHSEA